MKSILITLCSLIGLLAQTSGRYVLLTEDFNSSLSFSYTSISLKSFPDQSFYSGNYIFDGDFRVGNNVSIFAEIPFHLSSTEYPDFLTKKTKTENAQVLGNIKFGARFLLSKEEQSSNLLEFSIRLPTSKEFGEGSDFQIYFFPALYSDILEQGRFLPDLLTINSNIILSKTYKSSIWTGNVGLYFLSPTDDDNNDSETMLHYGTEYIYSSDVSPLNLGGRLRGIMIITEDLDDFSDRFIHSLEPFVEVRFTKVRLTFEYRFYLKEDISELVNSIFSIGLTSTF